MTLTSLALSLFLLMDPIGNIPVYTALLKGVSPRRQKFVIMRELLIALATIIVFYFAGELLLGFLRITHQAVLISGGIILFIIALKLIFPTKNGNHLPTGYKEPFIVPLAIPLVAGPAVLAAVMLYARQSIPFGVVLGAILIAWALSTIILLGSTFLQKVLGPRGIIACERLMGLILVMIAVQMFLDGYILLSSS